VTPGPDEDFLDDVICGLAVRAEPLHISVQSRRIALVELADRGVGVTRELGASLIRDRRHTYYHE
jgi:hypothetical protein